MPDKTHTTEPAQTRALRTRTSGALTAADVLAVQRSAGNRAAQRLIAQRQLQARLTVGPVDDPFEREADRMADAVLASPSPQVGEGRGEGAGVQRETKPDEDELQTKPLAAQITPLVQREAMPEEDEVQRQTEEDEIQAKAVQRNSDGSFDAGVDVEQRIARSKGAGSALPDATRAEMESKFGADFSSVRVHAGDEAAQLNRDLSAQAFTHGSDVYFGEGKFAPASGEGKHLLAHELTHVVQQHKPTDSVYSNSYSERRQVHQRNSAVAISRYTPNEKDEDLFESDSILESLAKNLVYDPSTKEGEKFWKKNYWPQTPIDGDVDFRMIAVLPHTASGKQPVLVFKGTDSGKGWKDDSNPAGVGMYQWTKNKSKIEKTLLSLQRFGKVIVVGHSLGGAQAQRAASLFPELINRVVTFQSPGINASEVQKLVKYNEKSDQKIGATHYRLKGDIVPTGGEAFVPGNVYSFDLGADNKHLYPLVGEPNLLAAMWAYNKYRGHTEYPLRSWNKHRQQVLSVDKSHTSKLEQGGNEPLRKAIGDFTAADSANYVHVWQELEPQLNGNLAQTGRQILDQVINNQRLYPKQKLEMLNQILEDFPNFPKQLSREGVQRANELVRQQEEAEQRIRDLPK